MTLPGWATRTGADAVAEATRVVVVVAVDAADDVLALLDVAVLLMVVDEVELAVALRV